MVLEEFNKPLKLKDVDVPEISPKDILVKVKVCSICGTDLKIKSGKIDTVQLPLIPGHEVSGQVEKVGSEVEEFKVGDRVTFDIYITCGHCRNCRAGRITVCRENIKRLGFELNGGMAEYMKAPAANAIKLPEVITYAQAALVPDAISTSVHAFYERVKIGPEDNVLILGAGGLGIHGLQVAKSFGSTVAVADLDERKLEIARKLGADYTFNPSKIDLVKACKDITNGYGMDVVGEYVGVRQASELGLSCLAMAGKMVMLGYAPETTFSVPSMDIAMGEREIIGSRAMTVNNIIDGVKLVADGKVIPQIDETFALEEVNEALDKLEKKGFLGRGILVVDE